MRLSQPRGGCGRFLTIRGSSRTRAVASPLRSRYPTGVRRRSTSACATTRIRTNRGSSRSAKWLRAWTSPTPSTASTARRPAAGFAPGSSSRCSTAAMRFSIGRSRGSIAFFTRECFHDAPGSADARRLSLLGARPPARGAGAADAGTVQPRSRQQLPLDSRDGDARLCGRVGVVRAMERPVADGAATGRSVRRPRRAASGVERSRTEPACVRRSPRRRRRLADHRVQTAQRAGRRLAGVADGPARRQSRELSPRPDHDDAAADRRRAAEADGSDRVLPRPGGEELGRRDMKRRSCFGVAVVLGVLTCGFYRAPSAATPPPTIEQFLAPGTPIEIASARKADRIAWTAYEHGLRNVYTAAAPHFTPVKLTSVTKDDGLELSDISISDAGGIVVFARGTQPNREGWFANPTADPAGSQRTIWAARTA